MIYRGNSIDKHLAELLAAKAARHAARVTSTPTRPAPTRPANNATSTPSGTAPRPAPPSPAASPVPLSEAYLAAWRAFWGRCDEGGVWADGRPWGGKGPTWAPATIGAADAWARARERRLLEQERGR